MEITIVFILLLFIMSSQHQHRNQFQAVSDCFHIYFGIIHYSSYCQPRVMKQNGPRSYTGLPSLLCFADWADVASIRSPDQRWKRRICLLAAFAARPVHKQRRIALRLTIVVVAEFNLKKKSCCCRVEPFFFAKISNYRSSMPFDNLYLASPVCHFPFCTRISFFDHKFWQHLDRALQLSG